MPVRPRRRPHLPSGCGRLTIAPAAGCRHPGMEVLVKGAAYVIVAVAAMLAGCGGAGPRYQIGLEAPAEVRGGEQFEVVWSGPDSLGDYITIVPKGSPEGHWEEYRYTRDGNPVTLTAPYAPGVYELRYAVERTDPDSTLGRVEITVLAVAASVSAPVEVVAGEIFDVTWEGPQNADLYVYLVPQGTPEGDWGGSEWYYVSTGNPLSFTAPFVPGTYEARLAAETTDPDTTLARCSISVTGGGFSLLGPAETVAGQPFEVAWTGTGASDEYLVMVPEGTPEGEWAGWEWHYLSEGNPMVFTAPDEPGAWEVRYATEAQDPDMTLARITVSVI